jgi:hypothetical protein
MIPIDIRSLDHAGARLFDRSSRLVGWGSGSVFDYFQGSHPIRLDYLVDNDLDRWGTRRRGMEIVSPARLRDEDPAQTFVIIYSSAWPEIQKQIRTLGGAASLPASALFVDASVRENLVRADALARRPLTGRSPRPDNAIVVQGPVLAGVTPHVLRVLTALHPDNLVVLSTWDDTDPQLLAEVGAIADDVVISCRPRHGGIQNRNYQIVSTRAGIDRAIAHGARTIVKTRTDLAVLAPSLFEQARWWLEMMDSLAARGMGLDNRLLIPSSFTRKFLLYHPSDLVMLGAADDMRRYWAAPLDGREGERLSSEWIDRPLSTTNMSGHPAESYLGLQFCRTLARPALGTIQDSWNFYRDLFAVVDNSWFDLLWFKNLSIPDMALRRGVRQMVTQSFWQRLYAGDPTVETERAEIDPDHTTLRALAGAV